MRLLIVRHAIAVAAGMPGIPDAERPLTPAGARKFRAAAKGLAAILDPRTKELVAVVGHEPSLSALLARLLGTPQDARLAFKKGGAALLEVSDGLAGGGQLVWYLPPRLLRALGE